MMGAGVYAVLRSKKASYRDKIKLCIYFTDIKNIFRTYDENVAIERLERLLDEYDDIPRLLRGYIRKKIDSPQKCQHLKKRYVVGSEWE